MKYSNFVLALFVLVVGCSIQSAEKSFNNFTGAVSSQFNRYNYYSDLEKYRPDSYRTKTKKRYQKARHSTKENWKNYKVGGAYQVAGKWYYPKEDTDYVEEGVASWYGPNFHNKLTANGEIFDKNNLSAAHKTLPLPSMVRVTNLENGRSIVVRVNDRGPFKDNRIIDLSERAAYELDFRGQGTTRVRVEFDRKATEKLFYDPWDPYEKAEPKRSRARHVTSPTLRTVDERVNFYEEHFVQAGAYSTWDNARAAAKGLSDIGPVSINEGDYRGNIVYKVQLGPFMDEKEAGKVLDDIAMMGFSDAIVLGQ